MTTTSGGRGPKDPGARRDSIACGGAGVPAASGGRGPKDPGARRHGLAVRGLVVRFGAVTAIADLDLIVSFGCLVGLIGPNGAGKTTVIDALSATVAATAEHLSLGGVSLKDRDSAQRARRGLRRSFQALALFEDLTVAENLDVVRTTTAGGGGVRRYSRGDILERFDLSGRANVVPNRLSHWERSRLALARTVVGDPQAVLLDEPAAGLDLPERKVLAEHLKSLAADGLAVLVVEHDIDLVMAICDEVVELERGRVVHRGPPRSP